MLIEPAVRLTEEVLWAVNRTRTVTKVVMTSSIGDSRQLHALIDLSAASHSV